MWRTVLCRFENENPTDFIFLFAESLTSKPGGPSPNKKAKLSFGLSFIRTQKHINSELLNSYLSKMEKLRYLEF